MKTVLLTIILLGPAGETYPVQLGEYFLGDCYTVGYDLRNRLTMKHPDVKVHFECDPAIIDL